MLDYTSLFEIASLPMPELRDPPWTPLPPIGIDADADIFASIRAGDVLVHHPYESFDASVERFIRDAADDPSTTDHQDDGLPPRRRHAVRALADPGGRERQAGGLPASS